MSGRFGKVHLIHRVAFHAEIASDPWIFLSWEIDGIWWQVGTSGPVGCAAPWQPPMRADKWVGRAVRPYHRRVGRGGPAAPWKIGRDKRPRLSHFPPEGEMSCSVHAPRISAAHAGGQVGRPRPSDPTIEMVGRGGLAAPTFPPRARCYGLIMNRALAAAHAGG